MAMALTDKDLVCRECGNAFVWTAGEQEFYAQKGLLHEPQRSEEHTSELQSPCNLVCRLLLEKKKNKYSVTCKPFRGTCLGKIRGHGRQRCFTPLAFAWLFQSLRTRWESGMRNTAHSRIGNC